MRTPEYQLVLQFPCVSIADFDVVVEIEERLTEAFADSTTEVDGHDAGAGEANIFILTANPKAAFEIAWAVIMGSPSLAASWRAAFRRIDGNEYTVLWPAGAKEFSVA